jgi:hypothetical protein
MTDNASGFAALDAMIATIQKLPGMAERAAPDVADVVEQEIRRTIAGGTTAYGVKWKLTQRGEQPLQHAAEALKVAAIGSTIYARLLGPEARHHRGNARGGVARNILPIRVIPGPMAERISDVLTEHFQRAVKP